MAKFEAKIENNAGAMVVTMVGVIDEDVDFSHYPLTGASAVTLKLSAVKGINSCGIREWIKWIGVAAAAKVTYVECPKIIVDQINMVQGFLPTGGKVESFYVPFYSDDSGAEKNILFNLGKEYSADGKITSPEVKDDDGNPMEMDVVEAKYFKFLKG